MQAELPEEQGRPTFRARIIPPMWFALLLGAMLCIDYWAGGPQLPQWTRIAGVVVVIAGAMLASWGEHAFRIAGTAVLPGRAAAALVTFGPYRFTRNPMYLGMLLVLIGVWLLLGSVWAVAAPIVWIPLISRLYVMREEALLRATFGDEYDTYTTSVRRWL